MRKKGFRGWSDVRDTLRKEGGRRRETDNCNRWQREGGGEGGGEREGEEKWREGGSPRRGGVRVRHQGEVTTFWRREQEG